MSISNKGTFISFEGIDGCGKSTQVRLLMERLKKENIKSILVREPGGTTISEDLRAILLSNQNTNMESRTEALLMTASRSQLTNEKIIPALDKGVCVVADRFKDSTLAYQGGGRGLDLDFLLKLNDFATYDIDPDITFNIDLEAELAFDRSKSNESDRIENAGIDFQKRVRNSYVDISKRFFKRVITVNGEDSISLIQNTIWKKTINCINEKN